MKRLVVACATLFVSVAQAQAQAPALPRQFNLECRDLKRGGGGELEDQISLIMSVDLDRKLSCRSWNNSCFVRPLTENGRYIDMSYPFKAGGLVDWEMSRIYDRQSGWLDQVVRRIGHHGSPYGDAVCREVAYTPFEDNRAAAPPANVR